MSDPHIKEAAALMDQAKGALSSGASHIKGMTENVDMQKLLPYLLAGGAGAVGGAALTGQRKERSGETRGQYLTRILRNAVATGALTGVGSYAATEGFKKTVGKVDLEHPITGKEGDQGPLAEGARGALFGAPAALIGGATALGATVNNKKFGLGANPHVAEAGDKLIHGLKVKFGDTLPDNHGDIRLLEAEVKRDPSILRKAIGTDADLLYEAKRFGLNLHDPGAAATLGLNARRIQNAGHIPSLLMGRTGLRRAGRGAIGATGAILPAVLGSLLTDRPE